MVGTYRLLRGNIATTTTDFYSEQEFELSNIIFAPEEILELGRSCIDGQYRRKGAMQLLLRGISEYIETYGIKIILGCGSIHGTDLAASEKLLSYLYHYHLAPKSIQPKALSDRFQDMNILNKDMICADTIQSELPPLLKGYLRVGGYVGVGAVIDQQFNTIDVCIVVETENITGKYKSHFTRDRKTSQKNPRSMVAQSN